MRKRFRISVNGHSYDVDVEELAGTGSLAPPPVPHASVPPRPAANLPPQGSPMNAPAGSIPPPPPAAHRPGASENIVRAPMPGTVLAVRVAPGQAIRRGEVLLTLEAMKMENEIMAPRDGRVRELSARVGGSVNTGDPLVVLE